MITLPMIYDLAGLMFAAVAPQAGLDRANPRRLFSAGFWGLYAVNFLAGSYLPDFANGMLVVALAAIGLGRGAPVTTTAEQRVAGAARFPPVVHKFGGDPAVVCALGMLSGFCGTLVTPMAATFNIVPAALILLMGNIVLMYVLAFPR